MFFGISRSPTPSKLLLETLTVHRQALLSDTVFVIAKKFVIQRTGFDGWEPTEAVVKALGVLGTCLISRVQTLASR